MNLTEFLLARIEEEREGIESSGVWDDEWQRRALAECEAKRRIIVRSATVLAEAQELKLKHPRQWTGEGPARVLLQDLALPYAGHPDYQPEWRP